MFSSYLLSTLFRKSIKCFPIFFYSIVHAPYHLYGHTLIQTHLAALLSFEPSGPLPVPS